MELFEHLHEINSTKLGYGSGKNGKAKTSMGMIETFSNLEDLLDESIPLNQPIDLPIFIKKFDKDCLSDMLTNILLKILMEFTLEICDKYNVATTDIPKKFYYWDTDEKNWKVYTGKCLLIEKEAILLVPKWFVRKRFYYNINHYFSMVILEKHQEKESWVNEEGKKIFPTKKSLKENLIHNNNNNNDDIVLTVINETKQDSTLLDEYHDKIPHSYLNKKMKDEELDELLYCNS